MQAQVDVPLHAVGPAGPRLRRVRLQELLYLPLPGQGNGAALLPRQESNTPVQGAAPVPSPQTCVNCGGARAAAEAGGYWIAYGPGWSWWCVSCASEHTLEPCVVWTATDPAAGPLVGNRIVPRRQSTNGHASTRPWY